jgi:hypothetical protein
MCLVSQLQANSTRNVRLLNSSAGMGVHVLHESLPVNVAKEFPVILVTRRLII